LEPGDQWVVGVVVTCGGVGLAGPVERGPFEVQVGMQVDARGGDGLVAEPERDVVLYVDAAASWACQMVCVTRSSLDEE
jgi:hypothetical protein